MISGPESFGTKVLKRTTAIKESNIEVARLLINRGCDLSIADNKNRSALHWAAQLGRVDFVEDLIRGVDPFERLILGRHPRTQTATRTKSVRGALMSMCRQYLDPFTFRRRCRREFS